jgi:ArsR family transcriptional regulator, arsenate/arsenite/antimonite-responsive transcriptional repressor
LYLFLFYLLIIVVQWSMLLLVPYYHHYIPTEIAEHFNFTLAAVSAHFRILKDANLIMERKLGKNRFYSLNTKASSELVQFLENMYVIIYNTLAERIR